MIRNGRPSFCSTSPSPSCPAFFWCLPCWRTVLLYRRFLAPFVNMGSLILAPLGAAVALHIAGQPVSLFVLIGILMLFGIVAKKFDPAGRLSGSSEMMQNQRNAQEPGDLGGWPQTRSADRHDHGRNGRRNASDGDLDQWRQQLARADGHYGADWRPLYSRPS